MVLSFTIRFPIFFLLQGSVYPTNWLQEIYWRICHWAQMVVSWHGLVFVSWSNIFHYYRIQCMYKGRDKQYLNWLSFLDHVVKMSCFSILVGGYHPILQQPWQRHKNPKSLGLNQYKELSKRAHSLWQNWMSWVSQGLNTVNVYMLTDSL